MMLEPISVFSRMVDPAAVAGRVREISWEVEIEGLYDNWPSGSVKPNSQYLTYGLRTLFGANLASPSVAQALAAHVIGVNNFAPPGRPSGVDRDVIGQLPSGF
jgi:hypothetical protein